MSRVIAGRYEVIGSPSLDGPRCEFEVFDRQFNVRRVLEFLGHDVQDGIGAPRFHETLGSLVNLRHDHLLPIHDVGLDPDSGLNFIVKDWIDGPTLREYLRSRERLDVTETLAIARQVASALEYAHAHGVASHRGVRPGAIVLRDMQLPIAVLALDGIIETIRTLYDIRDGVVRVAAYRYAAPEQVDHRRRMERGSIDGRVDIFALGLVMYEMIEGKPFFGDMDFGEIVGRLLFERAPLIPTFSVGVPQLVVDTISRAISRDRDDRYPTMGDFRRELEMCVDRTNA